MDMALIRFGEMSVSCVISNLTDEGAALDVGPQSDIPDQFTLIVMAENNLFLQHHLAQEPSHWRVVPLTDRETLSAPQSARLRHMGVRISNRKFVCRRQRRKLVGFERNLLC